MEVGEPTFEVDGWQSALHQTLSLGRDSFWVHQSLTFYTVRGEEVSNEHGILNGRWSCFTVNPIININTSSMSLETSLNLRVRNLSII